MFDIAIVGFGATGISLLSEINNAVYTFNLPQPKIAIFDAKNFFSIGKTFGNSAPKWKVNTPPEMLAISSCEPNKAKSLFIEQDDLYPLRSNYAQFLMNEYNTIKQFNLLEINEIKQEVIDIKKNGEAFLLTIKDNGQFIAKRVVLCLGSLHAPNFYNSEGRVIERYEDIKKIDDNRILIAGTSLTAVDFIRIASDDSNKEIHAFSRNGFIPTCLTVSNRYQPQILTWENLINKKDCTPLIYFMQLLQQEINLKNCRSEYTDAMKKLRKGDIYDYFTYLMVRAKESDLPYQDILVSTRPYMPKFWNTLSLSEKNEFYKTYQASWAAWRHPIPYSIIEELAALVANKRLFFHQIDTIPIYEDGKFKIITRSGREIISSYLIDGTGGNNNLQKTTSTLLQNMQQNQLIESHPCGGININPLTFECLYKQGTVTHLYSIGPLNKGVLFSTNALWFNAQCAKHWVEHWAIKQMKFS